HQQIKDYIGDNFRIKCKAVPEWHSKEDVCDYLLNTIVLIHLDSNYDKFNLLISMIQKLYTFSSSHCAVEGVDCISMQETILGGHFYLMLLKDRLNGYLLSLRSALIKKATARGGTFNMT